TAVINTATGAAELGVGSGITWDSDPQSELQECLAKGAFLVKDSSDFSLIETVRFDRQGYLLLVRHLRRLAASARYFDFRFDEFALLKRLNELKHHLSGVRKVRVLLARDGCIAVESHPITDPYDTSPSVLVTISDQRVDSSDPFLYHKTTRRTLYDNQLKAYPGCYDVIFLNELDQITEGSFNNIVISLRGELLTPRLRCGLLPGVLREELVEIGAVSEAILTLKDLQAADRCWLVNSVRGWSECRI
ncbi:MAG TPA: aminodeoxychorismate synthase, component I, partial [Desulfuromonadales bacterium]|nr:aminodeoxychorismate synthase, component I [Desulfuromonadales bacterium]